MELQPGSYTGQTEPERIDVLAQAQEEVAELGPDLRSAVALVCRYAVDLTNADGAALYLAEGDDIVCVAGAGRTEAIVGLRVRATKLFAGRCLAEPEPQVSHDTITDDRVDPDERERLGARSLYCQPIVVGAIRVGVLEASSTMMAAFGPGTADTMRLLAGFVTGAFRNAGHLKAQRPDGVDPVTGLPDPATYRHRLALEIERSRRTKTPVGLAMVRLSGYYDNSALEIVAAALNGVRFIDEAFLVDGGTFAVILPDTRLEGTLIVARKIAAAVTEPLAELGVVPKLGAAQDESLDPDELHEAARRATATARGTPDDAALKL